MELSALQQEFLDDHRVLISGLREIIEAMDRGDMPAAVRRAADLDHEAGAHMAFEEEVFYPRLARVYGEEMVQRMIAEHEAGHRAVKTILDHADTELDSESKAAVMADLEIALKHVLSCGTMLSELDSGISDLDGEALARLRELREQADRWTSRSYSEN